MSRYALAFSLVFLTLGEHQKVWGVWASSFCGYFGKPYLSVKAMTPSAAASTPDRLALGYQLKIHLLGISPQISRRVLVRGDTTLAELHHIFQVVFLIQEK